MHPEIFTDYQKTPGIIISITYVFKIIAATLLQMIKKFSLTMQLHLSERQMPG